MTEFKDDVKLSRSEEIKRIANYLEDEIRIYWSRFEKKNQRAIDLIKSFPQDPLFESENIEHIRGEVRLIIKYSSEHTMLISIDEEGVFQLSMWEVDRANNRIRIISEVVCSNYFTNSTNINPHVIITKHLDLIEAHRLTKLFDKIYGDFLEAIYVRCNQWSRQTSLTKSQHQ